MAFNSVEIFSQFLVFNVKQKKISVWQYLKKYVAVFENIDSWKNGSVLKNNNFFFS